MTIAEYRGKYNEITRALITSFAEAKEGGNIVLSPLSVIMLLGIAAGAVNGKARDEIMNVIGCHASYDEFMDLLKEIRTQAVESGSLVLLNAVCVKESISGSMAAGYPDHLKEIFDGNLFSSSDIVRDVNAWVKEKTKGMIEDAADESMNQMLACLMNAIVFEAEWLEQYEEDQIQEGNFQNADGTVTEVRMLKSSENTYIEDAFFTGFMKPYQDEKYAFMALRPKKRRAFQQIDFAKLLDSATYGRVFVTMPEFRYDFGKDLTGLCKELGMNTLFTVEADFSPMSREWLHLDSIIHKAHIEVVRKGTKAAAVTAGYAVASCALSMEYKSVCLDRPFVYAIVNTQTGMPVVTGIYNQADK